MNEMSEQEELPTEEEITEVLAQYEAFLRTEYERSGDRDVAIDEATEQVTTSVAGKTFFWIADNNNSLIYDVDDIIEE